MYFITFSSNNFNILAGLSSINFNEIRQNENDTKEQILESSDEISDDADNNEQQIQTSFNLSRVDKFVSLNFLIWEHLS